MNLYRISQDINNNYDTYDSAIVAASSEESARRIHPDEDKWSEEHNSWMDWEWDYDENGKCLNTKSWHPAETDTGCGPYGSWCHPDYVFVELIGTTDKFDSGQVVMSSFNAG